jgi:hypothetical protein
MKPRRKAKAHKQWKSNGICRECGRPSHTGLSHPSYADHRTTCLICETKQIMRSWVYADRQH